MFTLEEKYIQSQFLSLTLSYKRGFTTFIRCAGRVRVFTKDERTEHPASY